MRTSAFRALALAVGGVLAVTSVASAAATERHHRRHHRHIVHVAPPPVVPGAFGGNARDNVSSIITDANGVSYNRITGERYFKCMEDEGYGRVRPCDAGDHP